MVQGFEGAQGQCSMHAAGITSIDPTPTDRTCTTAASYLHVVVCPKFQHITPYVDTQLDYLII